MEPNLTKMLTVVVPCYNEEAIIKTNIEIIIQALKTIEEKYQWELLIINDGSKDQTGILADEICSNNSKIRVIHHPVNLNLGNALKTGFKNAKGEIIVVLDIDLSYSADNIGRMTDKLINENADIIVASPYMKGGEVVAVPFLRRIMSKWVNRFMRFSAQEKYYTFTGMVRAYKASFIKSINLKTKDYEINPEIIYKAMILRARIIELPARLDWTSQNKYKGKRTSSIRIIRGFFSGLMSAFIFRPYIFFIVIGCILLSLSLYELVWLLYDTLADLHQCLTDSQSLSCSFSQSLAKQFVKNPQSFIVGGITFLASAQILNLGFISLQNKRYFEELFHLGTSLKKDSMQS